MGNMNMWLVLVCAIGSVGVVRAELSCKDMDGKDVDWFIALKMPSIKGYDDVHPDIANGMAFYYADSNNQEFRISKANINDPKSAIGYTVSQAIKAYMDKSKDVMYAFYNDQPPAIIKNGKPTEEKELGNRAHAKGVMSFNDKQGFWLIHSAPRFNDPTQGDGYFYPANARLKGQSFFCGTFSSDQLQEIGTQIYHSQFGIYVQDLPAAMAKKFPRLYHVLKMDASVKEKDKCPFFRNVALKTKGGQWLQNYEKNTLTHADLWANQVAEDKKQSFFVETWLNGPRDWKNVCGGKFFTKNIRSLKHALGNVKWTSVIDHSKWAVSDKPKTVCIGDINRQCSQKKRGGGTMCIDNEKIWKFFRDSVDVVECCEGEKGNGCEEMPCDSVGVPAKNRNPGDPAFECPTVKPPSCPADSDEEGGAKKKAPKTSNGAAKKPPAKTPKATNGAAKKPPAKTPKAQPKAKKAPAKSKKLAGFPSRT